MTQVGDCGAMAVILPSVREGSVVSPLLPQVHVLRCDGLGSFLQEAADLDLDLIIVASHGHGAMYQLLQLYGRDEGCLPARFESAGVLASCAAFASSPPVLSG